MKSNRVAVYSSPLTYGCSEPFHPDANYPEIPFCKSQLDPSNGAYQAVRETLRLWGGDKERFGQPDWNPLGSVISPGMRVAVVPNLLTADLFESNAVITHPSIIRALLDYICIALKGRGIVTVVITTPIGEDTDALLTATKLRQLMEFYKGQTTVEVRLMDPRKFCYHSVRCLGTTMWTVRSKLPGDPGGYVSYNLTSASCFSDISDRMHTLIAGNKRAVRQDFNKTSARYEISRSIANADVVVAVPKLKTHQKSGVTLCVKGWAGIMTNRLALAHLRSGSPANGGDQYPPDIPFRYRIFSNLRVAMLRTSIGRNTFQRVCGVIRRVNRLIGGNLLDVSRFSDGGWYGNDTIWRACLDLHRIVLFGDRTGRLKSDPQRKLFCLIDGIVAGDGDGPYHPDPVAAGLLVAGENLISVDCVATRLMGLDPAKIPLLAQGLLRFESLDVRNARFEVRSNDDNLAGAGCPGFHAPLKFRPTSGWVGHIGSD